MHRFMEIPTGAVPVLLTPFTADNTIDYRALDAMVDFYASAGVAGLFSSCLSSEVFHLSPDERLAITRHVSERAAGRMAVVAGGNFGETVEQQAHGLAEDYGAGADAAVVIVSILPSRERLGDQLVRLAELTSVPLGVYECPEPEHRLLSAEEVGRIAQTGRFIFMKEASRRVDVCRTKLAAAEGTPLRIFQANLKCTPDTISAGAYGHAGVIANVCPELCQAYCDGAITDQDRKRRIYESMQLIHDLIINHGYPASGKYVLRRRGLEINTACRSIRPEAFGDADRQVIDALLSHFDFLEPMSRDTLTELRAGIPGAVWKD